MASILSGSAALAPTAPHRRVSQLRGGRLPCCAAAVGRAGHGAAGAGWNVEPSAAGSRARGLTTCLAGFGSGPVSKKASGPPVRACSLPLPCMPAFSNCLQKISVVRLAICRRRWSFGGLLSPLPPLCPFNPTPAWPPPPQSLDAAAAAGPLDEYFVFVRQAADAAGKTGRWLPLGELSLSPGGDPASAVFERRKYLRDYAAKAHIQLLLGRDVSKDRLEYGFRLQKGAPPADGADPSDVVTIPPAGPPGAKSVPARLLFVGGDTGSKSWGSFAGAIQGKGSPGPAGGGGSLSAPGGLSSGGGGPAVGSVPLRIGPSGGS